MASQLVRQLIAANEGDQNAITGHDLYYKAAERMDALENALQKVLDDSEIGVVPRSHLDRIERLLDA